MRRRKKNKSTQTPQPSLPPLPNLPPLPDAPLPPLPEASLPPLPAVPTPDPLAQSPLPPHVNPIAGEQTVPTPQTPIEPESTSNEYGELWAKRSAKPLPQIYGAIDRLGSGESGSLLDRYADRFGHELDRDIIVLRKKEREDAINEARGAPSVELLDQDEPDRLTEVEDLIRDLKPQYKEAKASGDKETLRVIVPQLEKLMHERRNLMSESAPVTNPEPVVEEQTSTAEEDPADDEADELFSQFFNIVNDLLGDELPEDAIQAFLASDGFELFKQVGADPKAIDDEQRGEFFKIIDEQLGNMPDSSIQAFVESGDFTIYKQISEMYT